MPDEQALLSDAALTAFRLNGQFLSLAETLAQPAGLTASWWQVLGAVLQEPLTVSSIARDMGMARQSVQRVADILVGRGLAAYQDNPAHRRAKLVAPTEAGFDAVRQITPQHAVAARALVGELGIERARECVAALHDLSGALQRISER